MSPHPNDRPFLLEQPAAYQRWREAKLARHPGRQEDLLVEVRDPRSLSPAEHGRILDLCRRANMALYASPLGGDADKGIVHQLGHQFGLERLDANLGADEDAITALTVQSDALHQGYIPYTNRPIAWHTDGYYNRPDQQILGLILHCVQPADEGGDNELLDHEIAYLLLRDESTDYVRALMHPEAMSIPANVVDGEEVRPRQSGPVFSVGANGRLHMRYTARRRNIEWRDDDLTRAAVSRLAEILASPLPWKFRAHLEAGQGLISNNVLHTRSGFRDGEHPRLLYRARYCERISGT